MNGLTDFLLARIAEVEDEIRHERDVYFRGGRADYFWLETIDYGSRFALTLTFDPSFILAECDAKRQIVKRYAHLAEHGDSGDARWVLPLLALPYAKHPDYREEWRP